MQASRLGISNRRTSNIPIKTRRIRSICWQRQADNKRTGDILQSSCAFLLRSTGGGIEYLQAVRSRQRISRPPTLRSSLRVEIDSSSSFCLTSQVSHDPGWRGACASTTRDSWGRCAVAPGSALSCWATANKVTHARNHQGDLFLLIFRIMPMRRLIS